MSHADTHLFLCLPLLPCPALRLLFFRLACAFKERKSADRDGEERRRSVPATGAEGCRSTSPSRPAPAVGRATCGTAWRCRGGSGAGGSRPRIARRTAQDLPGSASSPVGRVRRSRTAASRRRSSAARRAESVRRMQPAEDAENWPSRAARGSRVAENHRARDRR